jgi:hypothetical protein
MNSKQKGKRGELELAEFLREHGFAGAARGQQFKGSPGSPDVMGLPGHHIECKRVEALSLYDAYAQAVRDAGPGSIPIVAHRRNGKPHHPLPWLAILSLDDYLLLVRELDALRQQLELKELA